MNKQTKMQSQKTMLPPTMLPNKSILQRAAVNPALVDQAPSLVHEVLRSPGQPLEQATRAFMEPRFGHDFSHVRIHTDAKAAESARAVNAVAYTVGRDLVFDRQRYAPGTTVGDRLLAHELTHVLQQARGPVATAPKQKELTINAPSDRFEQESDRVAEQITRSGQPGQSLSAMPTALIQRQAASADEDTTSVMIDDREMFEEDNEPTAAITGQAIQRQGRDDVPPPPPAYPSVYEWLPQIFDDTVGLWNLTCEDRRERGFFVLWNENTKMAFAGEVHMGEPAKGKEAPQIELGPKPPDRKPIFPVGWFHTHPPAPPGFVKKSVGPSNTDKNTAMGIDLPGAVEDFKTSTSDCREASFFFFGPTRRGY